MRLVLTILLFIPIFIEAQTNYYVSNSGSNANNGLTISTPWQTIGKINGFSFANNDTVNLKCGDSWNDSLLITSSNLYFRSYNTGAKPIITGFQTQTGFSNVSGNIWSATATNATDSLNMVLLNSVVAHKARYPNSSYLTFSSSSGDTILNTSLSEPPNYTGYEIAVRTVPWIIDIRTVASQTGGALKVYPALYYPPIYNGNGFFFQNNSSFIDTLNEYSYNDTTKLLTVYSVGSPTVLISTIDTLVRLNKFSNLTFDNIEFKGANKCIFPIDSVSDLTITNCNLLYSGWDGINGNATNNVTVTNDSIINMLSSGVTDMSELSVNCDNFICTGNYIHNIGILDGMGRSGWRKQTGISFTSDNSIVSNNRIDSIGYAGIIPIGINSLIKNNYITNFCLTRSDGAGIYSGIGHYYPVNSDSGTIIRANIIDGGYPNVDGTANYFGTNNACGIYIDESVEDVLVDSNFTNNTYVAGLFCHNSNNITWRANTVITGSNSYGFYLGGSSSLSYSNVIKKNIFFANNSYEYNFYLDTYDYAQSVDSNYYSRWTTEGTYMKLVVNPYTLSQWHSYSSYDAHSSGTPANVTYDPVLYYSNPSSSALTVNIGQTYLDFYGTNANSFTIQPFKSIVLFKAINQIPPPAPPPGITELQNVRFKIRSL